MLGSVLKSIIPKREMLVPIMFGPFRGARIQMVPHDNLRKMFGLYEHELNGWLEVVMHRVDLVLDVGGSNGYFAFGCAAAFRRMQRGGRIITFEPQASECDQMRASLKHQPGLAVEITIQQCLVGRENKEGMTSLDTVATENPDLRAKPTLIKIDVEGAEIDVIEGGGKWLNPSNYFLIEVHRAEYLGQLQEKFSAAGIKLEQRDQIFLPIIGREHRSVDNRWLVTPLAR